MMGLFDKFDKKNFDEFKVTLENELSELRTLIEKRVPEAEQEIINSSQKIQQIENTVSTTLSNIQDINNQTNAVKADLEVQLKEASEQVAQLKIKNQSFIDGLEKIQQKIDLIEEGEVKANTALSEIDENRVAINQALEDSKSLPESIEQTQSMLEESQSLSKNISALKSEAMKRKSELDDLFNEIMGYEIYDDEEGSEKTEYIEGLKDKLETTYVNLETKINNLELTASQAIETVESTHKTELERHNKTYGSLISSSEKTIRDVTEKLDKLLPGAMAAGLSTAYEKKKAEEIEAQSSLKTNFLVAIGGLVAVSLIPFAVDAYLLIAKGADIVQVLRDTPSLVVSILPLYFPVLWYAYSANKKLNLSKRLIEEYTHKSVLGMTYDGLSKQIENLNTDDFVQNELRTKLLFNLLQVSAENPGKLISDYNKSDHPLMEALENSSKLSDSVNKLNNIPGFSSLATRMSKKSDEIKEVNSKKVQDGLNVQDDLES